MTRKKANSRKQTQQEPIPTTKKKKKICNNFEQARNSLENWEFHFKLSDIEKIKLTIKSKDIDEVPLIIGAVVLNEKDTLENLLKHGYNINEADKNNVTPLMWAVKLKHIDMVKFLIENNADPKIKPENRDDLIFTAISLALWDEETFLVLFERLKNAGCANVNAFSKSGFSLLHLAVRREWKSLVDILILNNANVNITTTNGITPLMQACYRNDLGIVMRLLDKGAAVKRRNSDGFTALCYAYSSAITKELQPPFFIIEKLHAELVKAKIDLAKYLKERLKMISVPQKCRTTEQPSPEQVLQHIFTFILRNLSNSFEMLTSELSCGKVLKEALEKFSSDKENLKLPLSILNVIFYYAPFDQREEICKYILEEFINSGCFDICIKIMRDFENDPTILQLAMTPVIIFTAGYSIAREWYEESKDEVASLLPKYEDVYDLIDSTPEQLTFIQECLHDFKLNVCNMPSDPCFDSDTSLPENKFEIKYNTKKIKRRSKALKATICKIKSVDLLERFNVTTTYEPVTKQSESELQIVDEKIKPLYEGDIGVDAVKMAIDLLEDNDSKVDVDIPQEPIEYQEPTHGNTDWKEILKNLPFRNSKPKICIPGVYFDDKLVGKTKWQNADVHMMIKYLEGLLDLIANRYKALWISDQTAQTESQFDGNIVSSIEIDQQHLQNREREQLAIVRRKFSYLTHNVRDCYAMEPTLCVEILRDVEKFLLRHSIRGETVMDAIAAKEIVKLNVIMPIEIEHNLCTYMENVLAGVAEEDDNVKINFKEQISVKKY